MIQGSSVEGAVSPLWGRLRFAVISLVRRQRPTAVLRTSTNSALHACGWLLLLAGLYLTPRPAAADPIYRGPLLFGLDPVIHATEDPRLLGRDRLVLRRRLAAIGVDPVAGPERRPSLKASIRRAWNTRANVDLQRERSFAEYNPHLGLMTRVTYPTFFLMFPAMQILPGGIPYYPPRPMTDEVVDLFVDEPEAAASRNQAVGRRLVRLEALDVTGGGSMGSRDDGLLNLTIPIKLPRTLEKIIGRGEKTRIKISGREHISISGESTVISPFTPTERVTSQSLFPSLDMEQELQINLSGTIGEKIIIEVEHNSAALGPDATKIKLMYQGLEDEIIKTIETGDVGLTLPGSQLLGYSSSKSGLFGIKVTGQLGPADFTVVASKQKAESSSKTFNSKGGEVSEHTILSHQYLNNRFFRLDLPAEDRLGADGEPIPGSGRDPTTEFINPSSIQIYVQQGIGQFGTDDIRNVAVYRDSTGRWFDGSGREPEQMDYSSRWRLVDYDLLLDQDDRLVAVDLKRSYESSDVICVIYDVVANLNDPENTLIYRVGDRPGVDDVPGNDNRVTIDGVDGLFYRMKRLKASGAKDHYTYGYVLRNIYSLGATNIDPETFDLVLERNVTGETTPFLDEQGISYLRIFGLDQTNLQGGSTPDDIIDKNNPYLVDLTKGLLKFPMDFPKPFAGIPADYEAYAGDDFVWDNSTFLVQNLAPELYDPVHASEMEDFSYFRFVVTHAAASSSFNLGVSNIEEGSESVVVAGRTLTRDVDYEIDYLFGQITLKGDAANLTADSSIQVDYQYAPFFGGGNTSLMGLNLGYDLGQDSKLSTTWLYQTESIVGEKAKLGEEPSKNLVGNVNLQHTVKPYFLTHFADLLSRKNVEEESSVQVNGELAVSLPNPNTKGQVYLEDFEGVDASDLISLSRIGWSWASAPVQGSDPNYTGETGDMRQFDPEDRVETVRWYLPQNRVLRRYLNPDLVNQERDETQQALDIYLRADDGQWDAEDWGGIMRGISRTGIDLSKSQFVELWINDGEPALEDRTGKLHIDFGYISEDGFWPLDDNDQLIVGTFQQEDGIVPGTEPDGVWTALTEDIGLAGIDDVPYLYNADAGTDGNPYPGINGTARNNREDTEDLNGNGSFTRDNGFFSVAIDLKETDPLVDVVNDYGDVGELVSSGIAWRKYRIRLSDAYKISVGTAPDIKQITHVRIWYEDDSPQAKQSVHLQVSELKFLGSRWEREGVRRIADESLLLPGELAAGEEFYLGEVNNKENPDYYAPFYVNEENNIPEKEQALVMEFRNLQPGNQVRASKQVSIRGDDYTVYDNLTWYWYNPSQTTADVDLFFRVGSDTLNFYEVNYQFADSEHKVGWKTIALSIAELSNTKYGEVDPLSGDINSVIRDVRSGHNYNVRVVGRPDLRNVLRYYFGIRNRTLSREISGYVYMNDVRLEGAKRDAGFAKRAGVRINMGDVIKIDADWSSNDAEFHGLNERAGSGVNSENWNLATSFNLDDFLPLAGFRLPLNLSRQQQVSRPKYVINSDIEIIDEDMRNVMSTIDTNERFTSRLSHSPSTSPVLRYLVDPWTFMLNGSRGRLTSPTELRNKKSLQGSVNYDLRIPGEYRLGNYPVLEHVPVLKGLSFLPSRFGASASFSSSYSQSTVINNAGVATIRPAQISRPGRMTANMDYEPLSIVDLTVTGNSERDLLREREMFGVNIGAENKRSYDLRVTFKAPQAKELPEGAIFSPLRKAADGLKSLRPSVQYTGAFVDVHDPGIRQAGDPANVRNLSNNSNWDFRATVPLGDVFAVFAKRREYTGRERQRMLASSRRDRLEDRGRGSGGGSGGEDEEQPDYSGLTPDQIREREEERMIREAEEREAEERERHGEEASDDAGAAGEEAEEGGGFKIPNPLTPVLTVLRDLTPMKVTYTSRKTSSYSRIQDQADFWYVAGFSSDIDVPDSLYVSRSYTERRSLSLATTAKIGKSISLDVKYEKENSSRDQVSTVTRDYSQDWPDAQLSVGGIEKWGILGGNKEDPTESWFQASNISFTYRRSKTVTGMTASSYNPKISETINPRWSFTFHSGLSATLSSTITKDKTYSPGSVQMANRMRIALQLRHQFRAQSLLQKLGLYRPGNNPTISMDVDMSYSKDKNERINPGGSVAAPTGTTKINVNPRFSYQVSKSLSGALRLIFGRSKNLSSGITTTNLGLGLEATFVF